MRKIINELTQKAIQELDLENSLLVYKGIALPNDEDKISLSQLFDKEKDKTQKWIDFKLKNKNILTYEQYLYFYEFISGSNYKNIYILNNNIYNNFYPLLLEIDTQVKEKLLNFFDDDIEKDEQIPDGENYLNIFSSFKKLNDTVFITYNDLFLGSENTKTVNIFDEVKFDKFKFDQNEPLDAQITFIREDDDYLLLLDKFINKKEKIYFKLDFFEENSIVKEKLILLSNYFENVFSSKELKPQKEETTQKNSEFIEILKKYWGYDKFRTLKVYDIEALKQGIKKVKTISQQDIIESLTYQAEKLVLDKNYISRDVFTTAPTGSGKSVMFQIPAMYLAEKYKLLTIVVSPLIGLMNDQVYNLKDRGYLASRTINSDISPIKKNEIINDIKEGKCDILYLSPESLLAKSDISQLIGEREIGMVVIDEAHIVTTWGKQFRPDYWYLGDYIQKLRKIQRKKSHDFLLATFTATAIYNGPEDMYDETIASLNMHIPTITYLGYVKREDIKIKIEQKTALTNRIEYELDKTNDLIKIINEAHKYRRKTLIYFPTVTLIDKFFEDCINQRVSKDVAKYYGPMDKVEKEENYQLFKNGEKLVMLATKAFGMGVDIKDIEVVSHYAPTGNVCDYVQEIGRCARDNSLVPIGTAKYTHMKNDFKYINRMHGLSAIKPYQLVKVINKVYELFQKKLENNNLLLSKKRNTMLVDAQNFTYIFKGPMDTDEADLVNKVKTALLLIEKDAKRLYNFAFLSMRPAALFQKGFFYIPKIILINLEKRYGKDVFEACLNTDDIYIVNLEEIWKKDYEDICSFPKFKYLVYSKSPELNNNYLNKMTSALQIRVDYSKSQEAVLIKKALFEIIYGSIAKEKPITIESDRTLKKQDSINLSNSLRIKFKKLSAFQSDTIANIFFATMNAYSRKNFSKIMNARLFKTNSTKDGVEYYQITSAFKAFEKWLNNSMAYIRNNLSDNVLYLINNQDNLIDEIITTLGFLEGIGYLKFEAAGGLNSQIYIKINQTKTMIDIKNKQNKYKNSLLEKIAKRHKISVKMLEYIYQNNFESEKIWDLLEDYFLGKVPLEIKDITLDKLNTKILFEGNSFINNTYLDVVEYIKNTLEDLNDNELEFLEKLSEKKDIDESDKPNVFSQLSYIKENREIKFEPDMMWDKKKVLFFFNYNKENYEKSKETNWQTFYFDENFDFKSFIKAIKGGN